MPYFCFSYSFLFCPILPDAARSRRGKWIDKIFFRYSNVSNIFWHFLNKLCVFVPGSCQDWELLWPYLNFTSLWPFLHYQWDIFLLIQNMLVRQSWMHLIDLFVLIRHIHVSENYLKYSGSWRHVCRMWWVCLSTISIYMQHK